MPIGPQPCPNGPAPLHPQEVQEVPVMTLSPGGPGAAPNASVPPEQEPVVHAADKWTPRQTQVRPLASRARVLAVRS